MSQPDSGSGGHGSASARARGPSRPAESMIPNLLQMLTVAPHLQATMMKAAFAQHNEFLSFLNKRCEQELQLAERICGTDSLPGMLSACVEFCRGAVQDYTEEATKVTEISKDSVAAAVSDIRNEARKVADLTCAVEGV